jgi:hypothetical protein
MRIVGCNHSPMEIPSCRKPFTADPFCSPLRALHLFCRLPPLWLRGVDGVAVVTWVRRLAYRGDAGRTEWDPRASVAAGVVLAGCLPAGDAGAVPRRVVAGAAGTNNL